tara:strand:+ start:115 stop:1191 length:1077 start_codon:yes stop_codon:yes gene_type:complete
MIKKVFGNDIDITENGSFKNLIPPTQKDGKFIKFVFIDVMQYCNINSKTGEWEVKPEYLKMFSNLGIRSEQNLNRKIDQFIHTLKINTFKTNYFPPIVDEKNLLDIEDGRKRIHACIQAKERYCPAAAYRFVRPEDSKKSSLTNAFISNFHDLSDPTEPKSIVETCGLLIEKKELVQEEMAIRDYLIDYANIDKYFHTRIINSIVDDVLALDKDGKKQILLIDRPDAVSYVSNAGLDLSSKQLVLFTPSQLNAYRVYCQHIGPNARIGKKTEIILYNQSIIDPIKLSSDIDIFIKELTNVIGDASFVINYDSKGIQLKEPWLSSLWSIKGVIPQKITPWQEIMYDSNSLISIDDFKNK